MAGIPTFLELLENMRVVHEKKNADYSDGDDRFSNFNIAADVIKHFKHPIDQVFAGIIGIKLGRISALRNSGNTPNNESLLDSYIDLTNYCGLWYAYHAEADKKSGLPPCICGHLVTSHGEFGCSKCQCKIAKIDLKISK